MPAGDRLPEGVVKRIDGAIADAKAKCGLSVGVHIGTIDGDGRLAAARWVSALGAGDTAGAFVLVVDPDAHELHISTSGIAALRIDQQQLGLAALTATTSLAVGDIVGGITGAIRMLADAAGPVGGSLPSAEVRAQLGVA